jgi:hypothetical protein
MRVDVDVGTAFAELLSRVVETHPEAFACCNYLETVMKFFCDSLNLVVQAEFNKQVVLFILKIVEAVPQRLCANSQKLIIS